MQAMWIRNSYKTTVLLSLDIMPCCLQDFYNFLLDSGMDPVSLTASELSQQISIKRYSRYLNSLRRATPGGDGDLDTLMNGVIKKKLKIIPRNVEWVFLL